MNNVGESFFSSPDRSVRPVEGLGPLRRRPAAPARRQRLGQLARWRRRRTALEQLTHGFQVSGCCRPTRRCRSTSRRASPPCRARPAGRSSTARSSRATPASAATSSRLSLRVEPRVPARRRVRLEALVEAFNLTNRRNDLTRNGNFGSGAYPTQPVGRPSTRSPRSAIRGRSSSRSGSASRRSRIRSSGYRSYEGLVMMEAMKKVALALSARCAGDRVAAQRRVGAHAGGARSFQRQRDPGLERELRGRVVVGVAAGWRDRHLRGGQPRWRCDVLLARTGQLDRRRRACQRRAATSGHPRRAAWDDPVDDGGVDVEGWRGRDDPLRPLRRRRADVHQDGGGPWRGGRRKPRLGERDHRRTGQDARRLARSP